MDERKTNLIADGVIAPNLGDVNLVVLAEAARDVNHARGHVQMKGDAQSGVVRPLGERLQVIHRLAGLDLDDGLQPMTPFGRLQDEIRVQGGGTAPDRDVQFSSGVDPDLETAAIFGLQEADDTIVLELLADRPHQNRAQEVPPTCCKVKIKRESLAWINQVPRLSRRTWSGARINHLGYNGCVPTMDPATASKILIVDDDESVTQTFASMLRLEGYSVRTAINAENGLRLAEESLPDAIILDLRMPLVDGLGLLRRLRSKDALRSTPVAIVTGDYFLEDEISNELRDLGAELRFKPMWLEDLVGLARNLLDRNSAAGRAAGATH
jgi:CheY-like chemotaxis protein